VAQTITDHFIVFPTKIEMPTFFAPPGMSGLQNNGAWCDLNSVLRQLSAIPVFRPTMIGYSGNDPVIIQFKAFVSQMRDSIFPFVSPQLLINVLTSADGSRLTIGEQQDASELCFYLLD
jgi:uncharacterized UBP type Zn finger protein